LSTSVDQIQIPFKCKKKEMFRPVVSQKHVQKQSGYSALKTKKGKKSKTPVDRVTRSGSRSVPRSDSDRERERLKIKEKILELERVQSLKRFASDSSLNSSSSSESSTSSESLPESSESEELDHRVTRSVDHSKQNRTCTSRQTSQPLVNHTAAAQAQQLNNGRGKKPKNMTLRSRTVNQR